MPDHYIDREALTRATEEIFTSGLGDDFIRQFLQVPRLPGLWQVRQRWQGQFPTIRATTESTMTERRFETDTATSLVLRGLRVTVTRYDDDTGRVDVTTDREANWSRFPVSGPEAMSMIAAIRSGEAGETYGTMRMYGSEGGSMRSDNAPADDPPWSDNNGHLPVPEGTLVDVRWRDGQVHEAQPAGQLGREAFNWALNGHYCDIVSWRLSAGAEKQGTPENLVDETVQGERIRIESVGDMTCRLRVGSWILLEGVDLDYLRNAARSLADWVAGYGGVSHVWTNRRLRVDFDGDDEYIVQSPSIGKTDYCADGFREVVRMLDTKLNGERSEKGEQPAEPLRRAADGYDRGVRDRGGRLGNETWLANPGRMPVPEGTVVDVQHRNGNVYRSTPAGRGYAENWSLLGFLPSDIVAWRRSGAGTNPGEDGSAPFAPNPGHQPAGVHRDTRVDVVFNSGNTAIGARAGNLAWTVNEGEYLIAGWRQAQGDASAPEAGNRGPEPGTEAHGLRVVDRDAEGRPMIEVPRSRLGCGHDDAGHRRWPLHVGFTHAGAHPDDEPVVRAAREGVWLRVDLSDAWSVSLSRIGTRDDMRQHSNQMVEQLSDLGLTGEQSILIRFVDRESDRSEDRGSVDPRTANLRPLTRTPGVGEAIVTTDTSYQTRVDRDVQQVDQVIRIHDCGTTQVYVTGLSDVFEWDPVAGMFRNENGRLLLAEERGT